MSRLSLGLATVVLIATASAPVPAQAQPTPVQEYRHLLMEGLDAHDGAIRAIVGGEVALPGHVADHAKAIEGIARMLLSAFPEGSDDGTRASRDIWRDWDDFAAKIQGLQAAAAGLVSAAESGDGEAVAAAAQGVGSACRDCHQPYRLRRGG